MPVSMVTMLDKILRQCGFIGTLIVGGPDPDAPNNIMSMIFQSGKTATGMTFGDSYPTLKTTMTNSFNTFAHKCLSKFTCTYAYTCTHAPHNTVVDNPSANSMTPAEESETSLALKSSTSTEEPSTNSTTPAEESETSLAPKSSTSTEEPSANSTTPTEERETSLVPKSSTSTEETGGGAPPPDITIPDLAPGTSSDDGNTIGSNMEVDPPQSSGQDMDIDIVPYDVSNGTGDSNQNDDVSSGAGALIQNDVSNEAGDSIHDGRNLEVAVGMIAQEDGDKNGNTIATQGENVAKEAQVVVMAPTKPKPIRYLDGKQVSEYEWERSETIKENGQLLTKLGLNDTGKQLFGKKGKEGKENRGIENRPLKTKTKKVWVGAGQRKLRSSVKAVPNTSVSIIINMGLTADLFIVLI